MLEHVLVALLEKLSLFVRKVLYWWFLPLLLFLHGHIGATESGGSWRFWYAAISGVVRYRGHSWTPGLGQNTPVLLHLPRQPGLHHALLRPRRLLQLRPQVPNHAFTVRPELASRGLEGSLFTTSTLPRRPGS